MRTIGRNLLANTKNPYQGDFKRVLCICSAGLLRSPTAARVIQETYGHNTRSAGISEEYALIPVDEALLTWADEIIVMESWMSQQIPSKWDDKIQCLHIEDNYSYMDPELQTLIKERYVNK